MTETTHIAIERSKHSIKNEVDFQHLDFGKYHTDHMFVADFSEGVWNVPQIVPYQNISISPATSALHYGQTVFEGFKAHRAANGDVLIFRPDKHWERMNKSLARLCMPLVEKDLFMDALTELTRLEKDWVPEEDGCALYYRPLVFATDGFIRVRPSAEYKFLIFCSPVGAYYGGSVKVKVEHKYVRAAEGGVGFAKTAGNYAASLLPATLAAAQGYQQILWTDGKEHRYFEESGTMNIMFVIDDVLLTPELSSSILDGVTRNSILTLAKDWGMKVEERRISSDEVINAIQEGRCQESFGTGTAAVVSMISVIHNEGVDYVLPEVKPDNFSQRVAKTLHDIKYGLAPDPHNWIYKV